MKKAMRKRVSWLKWDASLRVAMRRVMARVKPLVED